MKTFTETLQDLANTATTVRDRAIACARAVVRARFVQGEITRLRDCIADGHTHDTDQAAALLASYDAEMTRLCQIPGVLAAALAEMVIEETAP